MDQLINTRGAGKGDYLLIQISLLADESEVVRGVGEYHQDQWFQRSSENREKRHAGIILGYPIADVWKRFHRGDAFVQNIVELCLH